MFRGFIIAVFILSFKVWASISVDLIKDQDIINYKNLETVSRLTLSHSSDCAGEGIGIMIETRDKSTKKCAWAGSVTFMPKTKDAFNTIMTREGVAQINLITHPQYFNQERSYGKQSDITFNELYSKRPPIRVFKDPETHGNNNETSIYKEWIYENSIFEWTLNKVYTINDLKNLIRTFQIGNYFPKYSLYGYDSLGECLNCVTFSAILLEKMGVEISNHSNLIKSYIDSYTKQNLLSEGTRLSVGLATIMSGAALGSPLGPPGIALGVIGGIITATTTNIIYNAATAAKRESFIDEIFYKRTQIMASIIKTKINNANIIPQSYENKALLNILNNNIDIRNSHRGVVRKLFNTNKAKLNDFPPNCIFSEYAFNY